MKNPIPILQFITELSVGGAQSALLRLLEGLDRERFAPHVACLYNGDQLVGQRIRRLGIPVTDLGMPQKYRLGALLRLRRLLVREQPHILHGWLFHANLLGRLIGRLCRTPVIITSRRSVDIGSPWRDALNRWTARFDHKVIAVCAAAREAEIERSGIDPAKVVTISNGVNVDSFVSVSPTKTEEIRRSFSLPPGAPVIGSVGRLESGKGFDDLLAALARVREKVPAARLLVIGDGRLRAALETQARAENVAAMVVFAGLRTDVPDLLSAMDLFVLPSLGEGFPNAVLEAMAGGLPVVATAVGGTPEIVVHGETGLLVPPGDPGALAGAIRHLLEDRGQRTRMGRTGRERVCRLFAVEQTVKQTEELYEQLLTDHVNPDYS